MNKKTTLFAAAALAVTSLASTAYATLITYGYTTMYYTDATFTFKVGEEYKDCKGEIGSTGKVTPYRVDVYHICRNLPEM